MRGQKHLIKCRCVLPHLKGRTDSPQHQFIVFSIINDEDAVVPRYSQCNNCGIIHKVVDICKSEILSSKESMSSILSIEDIKHSLPTNVVDILERNQADLSTWENVQFIIENKQWGQFVLLSQEEESGEKVGKYLSILGENFFRVNNFNRTEVLIPQ